MKKLSDMHGREVSALYYNDGADGLSVTSELSKKTGTAMQYCYENRGPTDAF